MPKTITTTLSAEVYQCICELARIWKVPKKRVIEEAVKLLKQKQLRKQIEEGLAERFVEYQEIADEFHDIQMSSLHE
jgi:predicted transcriptional regulator